MNSADAGILWLIGCSVAIGAALGVCWGILSFVRILLIPLDPATGRRGRAQRDVITFCTDLLFSLLASVSTVFLFFGTNEGKIRLIGLVGCGVGFALYHYTVGKRLIDYFARFVGLVRRGISFLWRHTFGVLFALLGRLLRKPLTVVRDSVRRRAERRKAKAKEAQRKKNVVFRQ